jgi:starch synthase (maltosyl-transferring)
LRLPSEGRQRVVIEGVAPEIDGGRFAVKRTVGDVVKVQAFVFADGHDSITCELLHRSADSADWSRTPMAAKGNDCWEAEFTLSTPGQYLYTVRAWIDRFQTWRTDLEKRMAAGQELSVEFQIGADIVEQAACRVTGDDAARLREWAESLRAGNASIAESDDLLATMRRFPDLSVAATYERELAVTVDREKARFSTWYEIFPRSTATVAGRHGTFADCERRLSYIASMGFDVVYLPPIHPIGHQFRKGKNNSTTAEATDVGSPWAIGDESGGHTAIHSELGTLQQFRSFQTAARGLGLEIALDIAFQCTPDHPWTREHPEWFRKRPDGSIQYAENPPNKAFPFWEWCIGSIKEEHPDVLFLAEAFTRPHVMNRLAKLGFSQSYTYFTWRNTKAELTTYFTELTKSPAREYFRANLWPNTPDILPQVLQVGGRPAFMMRLLLAATLGANYGIYGPAFELGENAPRDLGGEEYLNSEKYEIKHWDLDSPQSIQHFIARVNRIRRDNAALQQDRSLIFHETDNPNLICYSKSSADLANVIIVVVNLDWAHTQAGWVTLDMQPLGLEPGKTFEAEDLLSGSRFLWQAPRDYVELVPGSLPGHVLRVRRWLKTERDFDYYL